MVEISDIEVVIEMYIEMYNERTKKYKAGERNAEIGYCNEIKTILKDILQCFNLLDQLDRLDRMNEKNTIYVTDEFLQLLNNTNINQNILDVLLKNRGLLDE